MPGRGEEPPLKLRPPGPASVGALAALLLAAAVPAGAQEAPPRPSRLVATGGVRATPVAGKASIMPGGGLLLRLGPRIAVGGEGWALPARVALDESDTEMSFGYGGVVARLTLRPHARVSPEIRLLVGAGNAAIRNAVVDVETDAENALVVEPGLALRLRLLSPLDVAATAGWRFAAGVARSSGLEPSDLGGWSLTLSASLGPF